MLNKTKKSNENNNKRILYLRIKFKLQIIINIDRAKPDRKWQKQ